MFCTKKQQHRTLETAWSCPHKTRMQDIAELIGRERVTRVVQIFYDRIRQHPTLSAPFARVHDWPEHEAILTHFWWVSLGGERYLDYSYAVARKHLDAGFSPELLEEWLALFRSVLQSELPEALAAGWIKRAELIGESLTHMHAVQTRGASPNPKLFRPA
jgi:hemoglobin